MEQTCLFCLDPIHENPTQNPIGCSCKILVHPHCFQQWCHQKQQLECPVCHAVAVLNPHAQQTLHVVYVPVNPEQQIQQRHEKCIALCCCTVLLWFLGLTILSIVFQKK